MIGKANAIDVIAMSTRVFVALGSNLGDREKRLQEAIIRLGELAEGRVVASSFRETKAEGMGDAPDFLNAVVAFDTCLPPRALLEALQAIEVVMGRPADHARNASRTIDLDIVCYGNEVIREADLEIPHPRAREREFVMGPLEEIAPGFEFPE